MQLPMCSLGGIFLKPPHTMARYRDAFYSPIIHDYANFGTWQEAGLDASARATQKWQDILANPAAPQGSEESRSDLLGLCGEKNSRRRRPTCILSKDQQIHPFRNQGRFILALNLNRDFMRL